MRAVVYGCVNRIDWRTDGKAWVTIETEDSDHPLVARIPEGEARKIERRARPSVRITIESDPARPFPPELTAWERKWCVP